MSAAESNATKDSPPDSSAARDTFDLLVTLARSLQELGLPSHRLEEVIERLARRFNVELELFSLPTGLFITVDHGGSPVTAVVRVKQRGVHLERLGRLSAITRRIIRGDLSAADTKAQIEGAMGAQERWGAWLRCSPTC